MIHICSLAIVLAALGGPRAAVPTLGPDDVRAGQRATVRTVFAGDSIETFDAEIVGLLRSGRVDGDLILAKPVDARAKHVGVAAGMSGSPVYVDGKLIGALAYGWPFSRDEIFGITPIGEMLPILEFPASPDTNASGPAGADPGAPRSGARFAEFRWGGDDAADGEAAPPAAGQPAPLAVPLVASGFAPSALASLGRDLAPLGLAVTRGGATRGGPSPAAPLEPGAAVAVDVLTGDLRLSAIGTLTYRDGDRVLIFGHPFFQAGDLRLPLSRATIATILASDMSSFKLGMPGDPVGAVTQDRRTGVGGRLGLSPRLMPFTVRVRENDGPERAFRFETVEDRALAPILIANAVSNSMLEAGGTNGSQTVEWEATLYRRGAAPLRLADVAASENSFGEFVGGIVSPLRFLYANPFGRFALDSLAVRARVRSGRAAWTLRSARLDGASVAPGGRLGVVCELESWRGGRETRRLELEVPRELPDGRYVLFVGGGPDLTRYEASRLPSRFRPTSLDDAWARFGALRTQNALYATLVARAPEVTRDARDYPELPLSALALLGSGPAASDGSRRGDSALLSETRATLGGALRGGLLLQVQVDARTPQ